VDEGDLFGEIGVLCNMPQPFMCRASQLTKVLRIDRNDFSDVVQSYVKDGSQVVTNLLEVRLELRWVELFPTKLHMLFPTKSRHALSIQVTHALSN
jgi:CRP-like cAMP-binding protein